MSMQRVLFILFLLVVSILLTFPVIAAPPLYNNSYPPIEWYQIPSLFFRTIDGKVVPIMASSGYRLPVDLGATTSSPIPAEITNPGSISVSVGSITVDSVKPYAWTTVQKTLATSTSVSATVSPLAGRLVVRVVNYGTETVWLAENSSTATVSSEIPVLSQQYYEENLPETASLSYVSSTPAPISIFQAK